MSLRKNAAFTMIELSVVLFIIGLLAVTMGPSVMEFMFKGEKSATQSAMTGIKAALANYRIDTGHFPSAKHGLQALVENVESHPKWDGPYLSGQTEVPTDKWGYAYIYNCPPQVTGKKYRYYELLSYGKNGEGSPEKEWLISGE